MKRVILALLAAAIFLPVVLGTSGCGGGADCATELDQVAQASLRVRTAYETSYAAAMREGRSGERYARVMRLLRQMRTQERARLEALQLATPQALFFREALLDVAEDDLDFVQASAEDRTTAREWQAWFEGNPERARTLQVYLMSRQPSWERIDAEWSGFTGIDWVDDECFSRLAARLDKAAAALPKSTR